jgi:hypothetical protein
MKISKQIGADRLSTFGDGARGLYRGKSLFCTKNGDDQKYCLRQKMAIPISAVTIESPMTKKNAYGLVWNGRSTFMP